MAYSSYAASRKPAAVYIMANARRTTLYVGVTSDLPKRIYEHKTKAHPKSFTARYGLDQLVYYTLFDNVADAITEEKRVKSGSRAKKEALIATINPDRKDLYTEIEMW